jgi:serine protease inhibitor ecotin
MTVAGRTWTCQGCGYEVSQVGTYYKIKKAWDSVHTLQFCKDKKAENAFISMFADSLDGLASLSIIQKGN